MDAARLSQSPAAFRRPDPHLHFPAASLEHVRAVLFELDGVLYEATLWRRWLLRLLSRMGMQVSYDSFYEPWDHEYLDDINAGRRSLKEALTAFLLSTGLSSAAVDEVLAAARAQRKSLQSEPRPLPSVAATLQSLRGQGLALAVSADSEQSADDLRGLLSRLGVSELFREIYSSRELRATKPAPVCYLAPITALGLTPQTVAFVGCRPAHLAGAQALGMPTIAMPGFSAEIADHQVQRFDGLLKILAPQQPARRAG